MIIPIKGRGFIYQGSGLGFRALGYIELFSYGFQKYPRYKCFLKGLQWPTKIVIAGRRV